MLLFFACAAEPAPQAAPRTAPPAEEEPPEFRDADLIFQASRSEQAGALRIATGSDITHVGVIDQVKGQLYVIEAVSPVKVTPLEAWRDRYGDRRFVLARADLEPQEADAVVRAARVYLGRPYDLKFGWDDQQVYCSELVWKAWREALGEELVPLRKFGDFPLENPLLKPIIAQRWGAAGPDPEEPVVAPVDLLQSPHLKVVRDELR